MADGHHAGIGHENRALDRQLPLETARQCFTLLVTGPAPLSVDGRDFPGLPNRIIPLDELRDRLLRGRSPRRTRDAVWAHLVRRSRDEGARWTLACTGMALPALASVAGQLGARFPGEVFDVHAEVLAGFLAGLAQVDLDRPRILTRLRWSAYRHGLAALSEALDAPTPMPPGFRSAPPRPPWGHPDLVLARAVRAAVLTRTEADLIGATRLEDILITDWADGHQMTADAAYKARRRAELRLVAYLREQSVDTDPDDPVASSVSADLDLPTTRHPTRRSSHLVIKPWGGDLTCGGEKPGRAVSKTASKSGLFYRGRKPPFTRPSAPSQEDRRCA